MQRDKPQNIHQLIHLLQDQKRVCMLKELAIMHLLEAITHTRHHKAPSAKIAAKLKELHPEWRCWVQTGNEPKFEHWKLSMDSNGLESNDALTFSTGYSADWDKLFEQIRRYDFAKPMAEIEYSLLVLDKLVLLEAEVIEKVAEVQSRVPSGSSYNYVVTGCFPLLFGKQKPGLEGYRKGVIATNDELKRIGITETKEGTIGESDTCITADGRQWIRDASGYGWQYWKLVK